MATGRTSVYRTRGCQSVFDGSGDPTTFFIHVVSRAENPDLFAPRRHSIQPGCGGREGEVDSGDDFRITRLMTSAHAAVCCRWACASSVSLLLPAQQPVARRGTTARTSDRAAFCAAHIGGVVISIGRERPPSTTRATVPAPFRGRSGPAICAHFVPQILAPNRARILA